MYKLNVQKKDICDHMAGGFVVFIVGPTTINLQSFYVIDLWLCSRLHHRPSVDTMVSVL